MPAGLSSSGYHHQLARTVDSGDVRLYLDGSEVAAGASAGSVDLGGVTLYIGEDAGGPIDENFIGTLDDAFITARALSPQEALAVHLNGAARVIPEPSRRVLHASGLIALLGLRRARRWRTLRRDRGRFGTWRGTRTSARLE